MGDLLQNPAIQSAVVPFVIALALAAALARTRLMGLAQIAGFAALATLAIGWSFESLTSSKKMVLIGVATLVPVLALEWRAGASPRAARAVVLAALAAACVWMLWRLLAQLEPARAGLAALLAVGYLVALVGGTLHVGSDPVRGASAGLMVGIGTGALAVLGASAVLGLVGISVGAGAGATLLVQMLRGRPSEPGATISLPASAIAGLAGILAVASASLPWFCLVPVLAAPLATLVVPQHIAPLWLRAFLSALAALVPMSIAVALAWGLPLNP